MAYPTGTDLAAALVARGILEVAPGDLTELDDIMEGVVRDWEEDTGWRPFLYGGSLTTRKFRLTGEVLFMKAGICSATGLAIEVYDSAQTLDTHFWMEPSDAPGESWPWTRVRFAYELDTDPNKIEVTARFGFCETLPGTVNRALLAKGMADYLRDHENSANSLGGSLKRIKQDDVEKEYEVTTGTGDGDYEGNLMTQFSRSYSRAVARFLAPWMQV